MRILLALAIVPSFAPAQAQPATAAQWTMSGRVVAEDGRPLAGCTVSADGFQATGYPLGWCWLEWCDPAPVVTGADGRFRFTFPVLPSRTPNDGYPPRVHLILNAPERTGLFGNRHLTTFFDEPAHDLGDFRLPRGAVRRLRVVDDQGVAQRDVRLTIAPVESTPHVHNAEWSGLRRWNRLTTGADGVAVVESPLQPGSYTIKFENRTAVSGAASLEVGDPPVTIADPITIVVAEQQKTAMARGRVVDDDGKPVAGFALRASMQEPGSTREVTVSTTSAADGTFELAAIGKVPESFDLSHVRNSRYDDPFSFGRRQWGDQGLVVTLARPAAIGLEVAAASGQPVEDLSIHLVPGDTVPGADPVRLAARYPGGKVHVDGLRATNYMVLVHARGSRFAPSGWIVCEAVAKPQPLRVTLRERVERTLFVFTDDGRPVAGATVELLHGDGKWLTEAGAKPGNWRDFGILHRTMAWELGNRRGGNLTGLLADRSVTDASGKVKLQDLPGTDTLHARVRGGGAQDSLQELAGWSAGTSAILIKVPAAGAIAGTIAPAAFITALDVSTAEERQQNLAYGKVTNFYARSLIDLQAQSRPGIGLRRTGEPALWCLRPWPLADDGTFAIDGVPPGTYDVMLVLRERQGERTIDRVLEPPLRQVEIAAGKTVQVALQTPAQVPSSKQ